MTLPKGFIDLRAAGNSPENSFVDIIGVVVDILPVKLSRSGQHTIYFKLLDLQAPVSEALPVRFFKRELHHIPQVQNHGDVVLLRHIKMARNSGQVLALSHWDTEAIVFPAQGIVAPEFSYAVEAKNRLHILGREPHTKKLSILEQRYVIQLAHDMKETVASLYPRVAERTSPEAAGFHGLGPNGVDQSLAARSPNVPTGPAAMRRNSTAEKRPGQDLHDPTAMKKSRPSGKFKFVRDLNHRDFADVYVEVVRKFPGRGFGECELYVTDYTENKGMYYYSPPEDAADHERDGDRFNYTENGPKKAWPGPYGQYVLRVILKHPHADYARDQVSEGELLQLKNLNAKHNHQHLEGEMWPDRDNPDKVGIQRVKDKNISYVEELLARKDAYWAKRRQQFPQAEEEQQAAKQRMSRSERKKQRKEQLLKEKTTDVEAKRTKERSIPKTSDAVRTKPDTNPHVRCSFDHVPISSVRDIQDHTNAKHTATTPEGLEYVVPFVNAKFRTRVRVVDFRPKQLEDFAHLTALAEEDTMANDNATRGEKPVWEWAFSLQLADAANDEERIWVNLHHREVQFLLGNLVDDPGDLRQDGQLLARLRETLFSLWGNVEEMQSQGEAQISNRPFECCIAEYGVPAIVDDKESDDAAALFGYRRQYSMFGVTIL